MIDSLFGGKVDAVLITSPINRAYFTGLNTSYGFVVLTANAKYFFADMRYYSYAKKKLEGFEVKALSRGNGLETIAAELKEIGIVNLGYEDDFISCAKFKEFKKAFTGFSLKPASDQLSSLRLIKTEQEIDFIKEAQAIVEKVFVFILKKLQLGITEKELRKQIIIACLDAGADSMSFEPIIAFGENSAVPHHIPSNKKLVEGDLILLDFGVKVGGYCSDMTRTFCLGKPHDTMVRVYDIVKAAQEYALKNIKPGMTCGEADSFAREFICANGYKEEFLHSLGHGIGLEIHEKPFVKEKSDTILLPGMVITIEPGVYIEGIGGVRIEDIVVVREDGIENLTSAAKKLIFKS